MTHKEYNDREFIEEQALMLDGFRLGAKIYDSGFRPDFIVGIWRGGSSVGIVVQECLAHLGVSTDHISIRTSYRGVSTYQQMLENKQTIRVHGLKYLIEKMNATDSLLIVDDVFSSGYNVEAIFNKLSSRMRKNLPQDIRVAVPWFKPKRNKTGRKPDYYLHETDKWLVLPYELDGLYLDDIRRYKPGIAPVFENWEQITGS